MKLITCIFSVISFSLACGCGLHPKVLSIKKTLKSVELENTTQIERLSTVDECFRKEIGNYVKLCEEKNSRVYAFYDGQKLICNYQPYTLGVLKTAVPEYSTAEKLCENKEKKMTLYFQPS